MTAPVRRRKRPGNGSRPATRPLAKAPTGIPGLDEITNGGLPRGRPTLVCGGAGCGKTLLAMEFLVRGALEYDEPGVFMSFEETTDDLVENAQSLGFDLRRLTARRRLRIVKYRGSSHGNNEMPFLIDDHGVSVLPITSLGLAHQASTAHVSTGVAGLDAMFRRKGYFRGNSVLVSGTAGTGKSSLAAQLAEAACRRGERCLYFAFEESASPITRNMRSIGIDLEPWARRDLLRVHAQRPTALGLEAHLVTMHRLIDDWKPRVVVVDPVTNMIAVGTEIEVKAMLARPS